VEEGAAEGGLAEVGHREGGLAEVGHREGGRCGLAGCVLRVRRRPGRIRAQGGGGLAGFEQEGGCPGWISRREEGGDLAEILHREMRSLRGWRQVRMGMEGRVL
jgi:hypothetical protein